MASDRLSELLADRNDTDIDADDRDGFSAVANDVFRHLRDREVHLADAYPFQVRFSEGRRVLDVAYDAQNLKHHVYVLTLLASTLRYAPKKTMSYLTKEFELLALEALRAYLPDSFEVHLFGTAAPFAAAGRYSGKLSVKLRKLAADLCEDIGTRVDEIPDRNVGDRGVDLVAWADPGDGNTHRITVFGQAAATRDWKLKQYTSSYAHLCPESILLSVPNVNVCCIPFYYRSVGGDWLDASEIGQSVLFDRLRICLLLAAPSDPDSVGRLGSKLVPYLLAS